METSTSTSDRPKLRVVPDVHGYHLETEDGRAIVEGNGVGPIWTEAEARRLAAAWNATRGIPLDRLESIAEGSSIFLYGKEN